MKDVLRLSKLSAYLIIALGYLVSIHEYLSIGYVTLALVHMIEFLDSNENE